MANNKKVSGAVAQQTTNDETTTGTSSQTVAHLAHYPIVKNRVVPFLKQVESKLPFAMGSKTVSVVSQINGAFCKKSLLYGKLYRLMDHFVCLLVFKEGLDRLLVAMDAHPRNKIGFWMVWFYIDYIANVINILLRTVIITPFKLNEVKPQEKKNKKHQDESSLPHVDALASTAKQLTTDLKDKVTASEYVTTGRQMAMDHYESKIKPTADMLQQQYLEPTYTTAKATYEQVQSTYEDNYQTTDSFPKAIVSTGMDIGSLTLKKLTSKGDASKTGTATAN